MPAAQPLSLDALRRLIAENDYWNPHSAQHQELQRKVSQGFGRLHPANGNAADGVLLDNDRLDDRDELIRQLKQRHTDVDKEYYGLSNQYAPVVPELDKDGNLIRDYVPTPPEVNERMRLLDQERRKLEYLLEHLGSSTGTRFRMEL